MGDFDRSWFNRIVDEYNKILEIIHSRKYEQPRSTNQVCHEFVKLMRKFRKESIPEIYGAGYEDPFYYEEEE